MPQCPMLVSILTVLLALSYLASAQPTLPRNFVAHLSGAEEVPARDTRAQGQVIFHLSHDGTELHYKLIVANIENVVAAHLHKGEEGENGPITVFLFGMVPPGGGRSDGILAEGTITDASTFLNQGETEILSLDDLLAAIEGEEIYANVHTNDGVDPTNTGPGDFPSGEVRGQVFVAGP